MADLAVNLEGLDFAVIGKVTDRNQLQVTQNGSAILIAEISDLVYAFKHPLDLDGTMTNQEHGA